jgi:hypothetical protein
MVGSVWTFKDTVNQGNKYKIPNSKFQAPNKIEIQKNKFKTVLDYWICIFEFVWDLGFGAWN